MDNRSPYPPVPNARAITEQEGSTQERVFLQYQFHQQTQTTLNEKWIFFFKNFFFQGCENPKETTKGESVHFVEPPLAALCMAVSHRCTHQRAASGNAGWQHPALAAAGDRQDRNSECWRWQH